MPITESCAIEEYVDCHGVLPPVTPKRAPRAPPSVVQDPETESLDQEAAEIVASGGFYVLLSPTFTEFEFISAFNYRCHL